MSASYRGKEFETYLHETGETGYAQMVSHPIVYIVGLPGAKINEVVLFDNGEIGWILSLPEGLVEVLLLSVHPMRIGAQVVRTESLLQVPVGMGLIGHTVNALGRSLYKTEPIHYDEMRAVESLAPGIDKREKITQPMETGVVVIDLTVPLGKGQRELVIGDRKTGKSEFLLQTLLTQSKAGTVCIYACVGKKRIDIKKVENFIQRNNLSENCMVVASSSSDALGMIYLTPYGAMSMAEFFRDKGRDVLLIIDDLTTHAKFYREVSLLSKKFPGRASYPGDIFYTHSRLLERAGNFAGENGPVSITCLPVAETTEGDISGYIQTNLMSITDGHIFFDTEIFDAGRKPSINYFLSVTRVGRQTQSKVRWGINRELFSFLSLYEKTQAFVHFGAELNEGINSTLSMGDNVFTFFNQPMGQIIQLNLQIVLFCLIWVGSLKTSDSANARVLFDKASALYEADPEFRNRVDTLVNSVDDFNALLGRIAPMSGEFMSYLNAK